MEILNIFFEQILVGVLTMDKNRAFSFQYTKNWLDDSKAFPLSISLPLQNATFCPISPSGSNLNPQNTTCIPVVKIFAFLELEQNSTFFKGLI